MYLVGHAMERVASLEQGTEAHGEPSGVSTQEMKDG